MKRKEEHRKTHVFGFRVKCDSVVTDGKVTEIAIESKPIWEFTINNLKWFKNLKQ